MAQYRTLTLKQDADGLAALFEPAAEVSHGSEAPVVGRPAIANFLKQFAGYQVLEYELAPSTTSVGAAGASDRDITAASSARQMRAA